MCALNTCILSLRLTRMNKVMYIISSNICLNVSGKWKERWVQGPCWHTIVLFAPVLRNRNYFYSTGSDSSFWQFSVPAPVLVQALYQDHKKYSFPKCVWELLCFLFITVPEPITVPVLVPLKSVIKLRFQYVKKLQFLRFRFQFSNTG